MSIKLVREMDGTGRGTEEAGQFSDAFAYAKEPSRAVIAPCK